MAAVARARGGIGAWLWRDSTPSDALAASAIRRPGRRITLGDTPAIIRIPPQDQLTARRGPLLNRGADSQSAACRLFGTRFRARAAGAPMRRGAAGAGARAPGGR